MADDPNHGIPQPGSPERDLTPVLHGLLRAGVDLPMLAVLWTLSPSWLAFWGVCALWWFTRCLHSILRDRARRRLGY